MRGPLSPALMVEGSHSVDHLLELFSTTLVCEGNVDTCSIFLREPSTGRLCLRSTARDAPLSTDARAAAERLATQALAQTLPVIAMEGARSLLAVPLVARGSPLGAIVIESPGERAYSAEQIEVLFATAARMVGVVEGALLIDMVGQERNGATSLRAQEARSDTRRGERLLVGVAASPGVGIGSAAFRRSFPRDVAIGDSPFGGQEVECERARNALDQVLHSIVRIQISAARDLGEEQALLFCSHLMLLNDPLLRDRIMAGIASKLTAAAAVDGALREFELRLRDVGDPCAQKRVDDIEDLRSRILAHIFVSDTKAGGRTDVIVSSRADPLLILEMRALGGRALLTERGGTTTHGVLLARSLEIPVVTGLSNLMMHVAAGDTLIVDGACGHVIVRPAPETLAEYRGRIRGGHCRHTASTKYRDRPAQTADGVRVQLQANVALGIDLALASENGADGVGLYRTEFPFVIREGFPTCDEQVRTYRKAYNFFPAGPISFRILDLAGDKFVPTRNVGAASDVSRQYRSIRVLFDYPHVLRDQVQAFAIAAGQRPLRILIPMISSMEELARIKLLIACAIAQLPGDNIQRAPQIGAMIEVPCAVEISADIAREVDFLSIGTNDLIQYALVAARENAHEASARDAYHPAILRMIERVIVAAHAAGKPVSVCGEMAARPDLAMALVALGVDALSVASRAIPELKRALRVIRVKPVAHAMPGVLAHRSASEVEGDLKAWLGAGATREAVGPMAG